MLPSFSKDRKPLLRSNSERGERPGMRNWPLFGFLFALVFFFYIVYVYQAQSAELESLRDAFERQVQLTKETKNDLIDAKAEAEKFRSQVTSLTSEKEDFKTKHSDCSASLRSCSLKTEQFQSEKTKTDDQLRTKDTEIETLQKNAAESASLRSLLTAQETISEQLNKTVLLLQDEIAVLKSSKAQQPAQLPSLNLPQGNLASPVTDSKSEAKSLQTTSSSPLEAPKQEEDSPPKVQTLPKEEDIVAEEKKFEQAANQVDAPKPPMNKDGAEEEDKEPEESPMKIKAGEYDDKPEA